MELNDLGPAGNRRFSSAVTIATATFESLFDRLSYLVGLVGLYQMTWPWLRRADVMQDPLEDGMAAEFCRDMHEARLVLAALPAELQETLLAELVGALEAPIAEPAHENDFYRGLGAETRKQFRRARRQIGRIRGGTACRRCDGSGQYRHFGDCIACGGTALNPPARRAWEARQRAAAPAAE